MTYHNANKYFLSAKSEKNPLHRKERIAFLLSGLGNPENKLRILPVTGGKGKGSVVRMLSSILNASGIPTGELFFPVLDQPRDNFSLSGNRLSPKEFAERTGKLQTVVRQMQLSETPLSESEPTREELLFCLALDSFAAHGCKWAIVESSDFPLGTGSRAPRIACITSCDRESARAASAIIAPELRETVSAPLNPNTYRPISDACAKAGCRLTVPAPSGVTVTESSLRRTVFSYLGNTYTLPLYGGFSVTNALVALETADALKRFGCAVTESGKQQGLLQARFPACAEILSVGPTILVDGADDAYSIDALLSLIREKGTSIGNRLSVCVPADFPDALLSPLSDLTAYGFSEPELYRIPESREEDFAKQQKSILTSDSLLLIFGGLPFASRMRAYFLKYLCGI